MSALEGVTVVEFAGLAPVPYCGMMLADFGARVIRVDRMQPSMLASRPDDPLGRGKQSIRADLKNPAAVEILLRLLDRADVLLDPYRPGVLERYGLGPEVLGARNPKLIYARLTGYGQSGPYRTMAGHDINYIALSGALSLFGRDGQAPVPPANVLGDFAAGGMLCALGVCLALLERHRSGRGQVVDAAIVDGAAHLCTALQYLRHAGIWQDRRGSNWFDTGAPWYDVYATKDGKYLALGAFEPQFFAQLLQGLGLETHLVAAQFDPAAWPSMRQRIAEAVATKARDEWMQQFENTDACVAPVLGLDEAEQHKHIAAREVMMRSDAGVPQASAAPRLERTPGKAAPQSPHNGEHTHELLRELGLTSGEVQQLVDSGAFGGAD